MTYSSGHKPATRQKIVQAANRLFAAKGYEGTSIDEIMRASGLTRGGFYAHFASKGELYREACNHGALLETMLSEYLGTPAPSAPSAARPQECAFLTVDIGSKRPEVRAAFTEAFTSISEKLRYCSRASARSIESCSLSTAALIVGALAVARTTDNPGLKQKLIASCKENVGTLLNDSHRSMPAFFWEPTPN
jgi:TetR/AcrR family transcriptional regulator, transcriptional repressor for nem operon